MAISNGLKKNMGEFFGPKLGLKIAEKWEKIAFFLKGFSILLETNKEKI